MLKQISIALLILISFGVSAQAQKGKITGVVKDIKTGETLVGASVYIEGTIFGAMTDFDGVFTIENIPTGAHKVTCSFISYETQSKENITVANNTATKVNFDLGEAVVKLDDVKVVARKNRESETVLLLDRKQASTIKESIGAQQLAVQGVSDAATAATKVTGITKQEGAKTLNVRGLGDRYNSTTLNGLPFPSNNAETKNIDLSIFSTDIIGFVGVEKVFTSPLYGDFAGANIDISSKVFKGNPYIKVGVKAGSNTNVMDVDQFYLPDGVGITGFDNYKPTGSLNDYHFENSWDPQQKSNTPNLGLSIAAGNAFDLGNNRQLNSTITLSYDNENYYSELKQNRVNGSDFYRKRLTGEQFGFKTQTTAMLGLNLQTPRNNYYLNSMLLNSSDASLKTLQGFIFDLAEDGAFIRRSEFERTTVWVNQLLGKHELQNEINFNWGLSYNRVNNIIPDRRHVSLDGTDSTTKHFTDDNESDYFRYFHNFIENEYALKAEASKPFGESINDAPSRAVIKAGISGKYKVRDFESTQFNHDIYRNRNVFDPNYFVNVDVNNIDGFLNNNNLKRQEFFLKTFFGNTIRPSFYKGSQIISAGYGSLEYHLSEKWLAVLGLRLENVFQKIEYTTALKPEGGEKDFNEFQILPSLSLKYKMNEKNNLRFALGKTYTLPQFTEMALFSFEGITETTQGNPYLYPSSVYNGEIKWELFPKNGELFSISAFGKYIIDPINRVVMASASNDFTYANTGDWAYVAGAEMELQKNIFKVKNEEGENSLFLTANLALMTTKQDLNAQKLGKETQDKNGNSLINVNFNSDNDKLEGAAPIVANASLRYKYGWKQNANSITTSLVYGYVSDRLYLIGTNTFGNQVDKAIHNLDFVVKSRLGKIGVDASVKNILNPDVERMQENTSQDFLVRSYQKGIKFSVSVNYTF
ncbi:TonB-dependent receptor [Prolixibacteraceae bacterium JC049]|nr:TonB-dependent receptor [Prolixibacteraceae bacterium JC049]